MFIGSRAGSCWTPFPFLYLFSFLFCLYPLSPFVLSCFDLSHEFHLPFHVPIINSSASSSASFLFVSILRAHAIPRWLEFFLPVRCLSVRYSYLISLIVYTSHYPSPTYIPIRHYTTHPPTLVLTPTRYTTVLGKLIRYISTYILQKLFLLCCNNVQKFISPMLMSYSYIF